MDKTEFNNLDSSGKNRAIIENYTDISLDESYDKNLYFTAIASFFNSEQFANLSEDEKQQLSNIFEELKSSMESKKLPGKFKLPDQFYLKLITSILDSFSNLNNGLINFSKKIDFYKKELNYIKQNDNKFDEKTAMLLWEIYQRDDLSIGIHGTKLEDDFDISPENCDFFKHGIMVNEKYKNGDARRTVNFQDLPGKQWAFGYISFLGLMNYEYESINARNNSETPMANYSCIVVRPKNMQNTAYDPECPQEYSMVSPSTHIITNDKKYIYGHLIKPEFILGIFKNNEQFILNPKYDLDRLSQLNETLKQRNNEMKAQQEVKDKEMVDSLAQQTANVSVLKKQGILSLFQNLLHKNHTREKNDSENWR